MPEYRLGDDIDDFCIKCKRVTNHSIVSLMGEDPAKVRCRTCYNDHDYRRCEIPPSKKELKRLQMLSEATAEAGEAPSEAGEAPSEEPPATAEVEEIEEAPKAKRAAGKKRA